MTGQPRSMTGQLSFNDRTLLRSMTGHPSFNDRTQKIAITQSPSGIWPVIHTASILL